MAVGALMGIGTVLTVVVFEVDKLSSSGSTVLWC